jgi:hypothetical protein
VYDYDEGEGSRTFVFEKQNENVGFQMFITPDPGDDPLGPADIELEFPTLKMQGVQSVTVGKSTPAVAFASESTDLGPDRELWFTHAGLTKLRPTPIARSGSHKSSTPSAFPNIVCRGCSPGGLYSYALVTDSRAAPCREKVGFRSDVRISPILLCQRAELANGECPSQQAQGSGPAQLMSPMSMAQSDPPALDSK